MNFVEKHSKLLAAALCICASVPVLSTVHAYEVQPGWHSDGNSSYYVLDNHQKATGLTDIKGEMYLFSPNGEMQTGWQNVQNKTYFFDNDGKAVKGKTEIQGTTYNFQPTGSLYQGWNEDESYYNEKGFKTVNGWVTDETGRYFLDENGNRIKNDWKEIDGNKYYFGEDGKVAVGQVVVGDSTYYTDDQGVFNTGWVETGAGKVFYNEDGSLNTDTFKDIDGVKYAFNSDGFLIINGEVDGMITDENGVATEKPAPVVPETPAAPTPAEPVTPVTPVTPAPAAPVNPTPAAPETVLPEVPVAPENYENITPEYVAPVTPEYTAPEYVAPEYVEPEYTVPEYVEPEYVEPTPAPAPTPSYSDKAASIYAAAAAQLGVNQDCTRLVSNALAAVGISFHGWPEDYAALGSWTSNPIPGDIIIYSGHVAIYAGNGMAVHGGFYGNQTVMYSVNCTNALIGYIRVA